MPSPTSVFGNAGLIVASTVSGSAAGFLFWLVAARNYPVAQVGTGAAYLSAIGLLATVADMGLSSALIRFGPGMGGRQVRFVNSVNTAVALTTVVAGVIFCVGIPLWAPTLSEVAHPGPLMAVFVASALATSLAQLQDKICIAYESMRLLLARNLIEDVLRIGLPLAFFCRDLGGLGLALSLGLASAVTVVVSILALLPRAIDGFVTEPILDLGLIRDKIGYTLGSHASQLLRAAPVLVYPIMVVDILGPRANGRFYLSWMLANLLFIVPGAVFTASFARAANAGDLDERVFWRTVRLTLVGLVVPAILLAAGAPIVLGIFGAAYAHDSTLLLVLLMLSTFPYTLNTAIITHHRITLRTRALVLVTACMTGLCFGLSLWLGASRGVSGVAAGWLAGQAAATLIAGASMLRGVSGQTLASRLGLRARSVGALGPKS